VGDKVSATTTVARRAVAQSMSLDDLQHERVVLKNRVRRRGIYLLPNLFTTGALFAGFYAIVQAMNVNFDQAAVAVFVAMVLDGLDGRVARLTRTQSAFGAEFDSLADMVSFGAAPALVMYEWVLRDLGRFGWFAAFLYVAGPRCGSRASTRCWRSRTSAGSWVCPALRRRRSSRAWYGSSTISATTPSRCAGSPGASRCSRALPWSATCATGASRRSI
jgi:phosphatidylglycerophosphate synthase